MKKFKIKCISSLCLGIMLVSLFTIPCSAHEMYYMGTTPVVLKWNEIVDGKAYLRINGDALNSTYSFHYATIRSAWNNSANKVTVVQSSFSTSTVDLATASEEYWFERWGYDVGEYYAICDNRTTDGYLLNSAETAQASSKRIRYAQIYFTPNNSMFVHDTHRRKVMVHEIGYPNLNKIQTFSEKIA